MGQKLDGQWVLVTGGATGIGRAICARLAHEGANVWVDYIDHDEDAFALQEELERLGAKVRLSNADVSRPEAMHQLMAEIKEAGGVHALVHAASPPMVDRKFSKARWEDFLAHWEVGVHGAFLLCQGLTAIKGTNRLSSIVFILSSVTFNAPPADNTPYITAKYALLGLARSLAVDLASKRVRVNCVSPGFTRTRLTAHVDDRIQELIVRAVPLKRLCTPEDTAAAVAFLLGSDSSYVTGVNLPVTGGAGF